MAGYELINQSTNQPSIIHSHIILRPCTSHPHRWASLIEKRRPLWRTTSPGPLARWLARLMVKSSPKTAPSDTKSLQWVGHGLNLPFWIAATRASHPNHLDACRSTIPPLVRGVKRGGCGQTKHGYSGWPPNATSKFYNRVLELRKSAQLPPQIGNISCWYQINRDRLLIQKLNFGIILVKFGSCVLSVLNWPSRSHGHNEYS